MKDFFEYINEKAGLNEPFELQDIEPKDFSYANIRQQLSRLVRQGKIARFSQGVYYIPTQTIFGVSSLNPEQVIQKKYLGTSKNIHGFPIGLFFENEVGLSQQVPVTLEIVTNQEKSKKRTLKVGSRQVILRKPLTPIDSANYKYIQLLEYMRLRDIFGFGNDQLAKMRTYVSQENLSRVKMMKALGKYPAIVSKRLLQSGILEVLQ